MSTIPRGIPTIAYCRVLPSTTSFGSGDVMVDGNAVVVHEAGQPSTRYEVAQVLDRTVSDEEACELSFGHRAGGGVGEALNPATAFVKDAANVVVLLIGSNATRKWQFLKRTFLPFIANEIVSTIAEKSHESSSNAYKAQLTLSAFEIQDEIVCDLLRPGNRGLSIETTLEEGVIVSGMHRETVVDETTLRKCLLDACDNRAVQTLPVGGSIDTSSGIFEFRLYQSDNGTNAPSNNSGQGGGGMSGLYQSRESYSRLIVVDVPSVDPLVMPTQETRLLAGPTLHKSLITFMDVARKLNNPYRAQIAPFRGSRLTHYLSELLGGNAVVVAVAQIAAGEPAVTKKTMEALTALNAAQHYPIGARELSDTLRGLLGKYRAMLMHMQDDMHRETSSTAEQEKIAQDTQRRMEALQRELSQALAEQSAAVEDRSRMFELAELLKAKYQTVLNEKLSQSAQLAEVEEDNLALAKTIVELNLQIATLQEQHEKEKFDLNVELLQRNTRIASLEDELKERVASIEKLTEELAQKTEIIAGNGKEIAEFQQEKEANLKEISDLKEKNVELGAELLTLVNHKDLLKDQHDKMKAEYDEMLLETQTKRDKEKTLEDEIRRLLEKLLAKDEEALDMRKQLMSASETAANARIESVASKRSAEDMQQVKEELEAKKMQQEEDRRRYAEITETLKEKLFAAQNSLRSMEQQRDTLERFLEDKETLCTRTQRDLEELRQQLQEEQEERQRLIAELENKIIEEEKLNSKTQEAVAMAESLQQKIDLEGQDQGMKRNESDFRKDKIRRVIDAMKVSAHEKKEQQAQRREEELQRQVVRLTEDLSQRTRVLRETEQELEKVQSKYRDLLQSSLLLKAPADMPAAINQQQNQLEEVKDQRKEHSSLSVDDALKTLLQSFEDRERSLMVKTTSQTDTNQALLNAYRELYDAYCDTVHGIEDALTAVQEMRVKDSPDNNDVESTLKSLVQNPLKEKLSFSSPKLKSAEELLAMQQSTSAMDAGENNRSSARHDIESKERVAAIIAAYQMQLREAEIKSTHLQQQYITQQIQLKQLLNKNSESPPATKQSEVVANAQYDNLIAEIKELRKQIFSKDSVPSRKPSAQLMQVLRDAVSGGALGKDDSAPGKPSAGRGSDQDKDEVRNQLIAAESRAAQAVARVASVEEELDSYRKYMKESVLQYQRQIQALQSELQRKKDQALKSKPISDGSASQKSQEVKFPPIGGKS